VWVLPLVIALLVLDSQTVDAYCCDVLQKAGGMPPNGFLPESLVLSSEVLDSGGVYLLDSGADLLLYVTQEAPEQIVQVRELNEDASKGLPGQ
jgi:hypothetical protein